MLYMIAYPNVQERVQQEIDLLVERRDGLLPELSDKPNLPYTVAVILEIMRLQTVGPLAVPHCASTNTHIQGRTPPPPIHYYTRYSSPPPIPLNV